MATPYLKSWTPSTSYEFELFINDQDYSNDLVRIEIRSSVSNPYQNVNLELYIDSTDLITKGIYGQDKIKLSVILKGETQASDERVDMELMFLRIRTDYSMQRATQSELAEQIERTSIMIETLLRDPYISMNTQVNQLFVGQTPQNIITQLVNTYTNAKLEYDTNARNPLVIDQFLVPPSTLYRAILYLDRTYGVFKGILSTTCSFDNTIKIQNLSKKIQSEKAFVVYLLATDIDNSKILQSDDPTVFYTKQPVELLHRGNSIVSDVGPDLSYMVKPSNELYKEIQLNTNNTALENGITTKRQGIDYDSNAIKRRVFHTNNTGYDKDEIFARASLAKAVAHTSTLSIGLQHNLPILNLMRVGSSVNFIPQVTDYTPMGGFYILRSSEIGWIRSKVWESWARIYLIRSNVVEN